jgi:uncharacterized membrane protein
MIGFHLVWLTVLFMGLAVPIVVIILIVLAVSSSHRGAYSGPLQPATPARETPAEILARRFASGEITADEYQRAVDLLKGGAQP